MRRLAGRFACVAGGYRLGAPNGEDSDVVLGVVQFSAIGIEGSNRAPGSSSFRGMRREYRRGRGRMSTVWNMCKSWIVAGRTWVTDGDHMLGSRGARQEGRI